MGWVGNHREDVYLVSKRFRRVAGLQLMKIAVTRGLTLGLITSVNSLLLNNRSETLLFLGTWRPMEPNGQSI